MSNPEMKSGHKGLWIGAMICCVLLALVAIVLDREPPTDAEFAHEAAIHAAELEADERRRTEKRLLEERRNVRNDCRYSIKTCYELSGAEREKECMQAIKPIIDTCSQSFDMTDILNSEVHPTTSEKNLEAQAKNTNVGQ